MTEEVQQLNESQHNPGIGLNVDPNSSLTKFSDKILYYKNALPDIYNLVKDLDTYQEQYNKSSSWIGSWEEWTSNNDPEDIYGEQRTGYFNGPSGASDNILHEYSEYDSKSRAIAVSVKEALDSLVLDYAKNTDTVNHGYLPNTFFIRKYRPEKGMGEHFDKYPGDENETTLSAVIYVNDDYNDGEIEFPEYELSIKPEAGSILFFPAGPDYLHVARPAGLGARRFIIPIFWYANYAE